ncbi:MAG: two-component sensor histidine kinase [Pseudodesulfovibrio sp.]|uniref:histidine kinase n=1 Tax=Pseudodesulfovibrio aespoeensis (strain ATCC 700646 / DSM 10631 / Aspo-2) TaxID=643562 RepID=E6VUJ7_PSEA9|nr:MULTISPECIES: PAS domain-containing sensor histidine kinase [Pseudodesulfovibrio]MBU4191043.1 two-component sensor histidine kinase [Pseudomonadota bacterium]ADU61142.1 ATP-binding region ATPase domain protein [Pseudodesulfovibrio aespoeensis Aspo-2]MBU4244390.1 two-component sensor histidine kinase [Pseudomonadota bacterium]MBU4378766.1 two-component sensor histidine kinase [Pseudomonadota bacterium]MBU4475785.1 two-component sensor histidine kinase [Pseudomonadota bacterium]
MIDKKYSGLRWKIIGGTMAFSLIPLFAIGLFVHNDFQSAYHAKITKNLSTMVEDKQRALDMFLNERAAQLRTILYSHSPDSLADKTYLQNLFNATQTSAQSFVDMGFIDQQGAHLAYVGPFALGEVNYREAEWFQKTLLKGINISDVFMGFRKYPHFVIAVSRNENGKTWVLRATIDSDVFDRLVQAVQVGRRGDAFVVNENNLLQTHSRFLGPILETSPLPTQPRFKGVRVEHITLAGRNMFLGTTWLDSLRWRLVILEDPAEELSSLWRTTWLLVGVCLIGVLVIFLGATLMAQAIVRKVMLADREKAILDASLMQSSKMAALGKLAAGVAHEVNNPLTLIREGAGWLKDMLADEDPQTMKNHAEFARSLDMIELHVDRAREVTHRMLGFGRRMEPLQENVDLNVLAEQTIRFLRQEALHRNIAITTDMSGNLPRVTTDGNQLQQVILNILDNALDAVGQQGEIWVGTGTDDERDEVFLSIRDTGPGMPCETMEHIFEPFYTTKAVGEGTGLGLSICFSIIEKLGGHIEVQSAQGEGSTFTIRLPRQRA